MIRQMPSIDAAACSRASVNSDSDHPTPALTGAENGDGNKAPI